MVSSISSIQSGFSAFDISSFTPAKVSSDFEGVFAEASDTVMADDPASESSKATKESSENNYDPADLNKDGKVSAQEALAYLQMQLTEKMSSEMSAQSDSNFQSSQEQLGKFSNLEDFKMSQAAGKYSAAQSAVNPLEEASMLSLAV